MSFTTLSDLFEDYSVGIADFSDGEALMCFFSRSSIGFWWETLLDERLEEIICDFALDVKVSLLIIKSSYRALLNHYIHLSKLIKSLFPY